MIHTPVALFIFNRPETTGRVFAAIAEARPRKLLVIADGPRPGRPDDVENCAAARAIVECVDWDCEVLTNYAEANLGCRRRVSSGLDWVFDTVQEAIILEDDCLPHPTFFRFCEELLERYRHDECIMHIGGANFQLGWQPNQDSYFFSRYCHVWGWASWRRAWRHYDVAMEQWPALKARGWLGELLGSRPAVRFWERSYQAAYEGRVDSWDYQWMFACWSQGGLSIHPSVNLVRNIGVGAGATHTAGRSWFAGLPASAMNFPLQHPARVARDARADAFTQHAMFGGSLPERAWGSLMRSWRSRRRGGVQ